MNKPGQLNKRFLFDRGGQPTERLPPLIMSFSLADRETSPNDKMEGTTESYYEKRAFISPGVPL